MRHLTNVDGSAGKRATNGRGATHHKWGTQGRDLALVGRPDRESDPGGDLSAREALEASLLRLEVLEPIINTFGDRTENTLERAAADEAQACGAELGPLHGVPAGTDPEAPAPALGHPAARFLGLPLSALWAARSTKMSCSTSPKRLHRLTALTVPVEPLPAEAATSVHT